MKKPTNAEMERIKILTEYNLKILGRRYRKAAEEMAIAQVALEVSGKKKWS